MSDEDINSIRQAKIQRLRNVTGSSLAVVQLALEESGWDVDRAVDWIRWNMEMKFIKVVKPA